MSGTYFSKSSYCYFCKIKLANHLKIPFSKINYFSFYYELLGHQQLKLHYIMLMREAGHQAVASEASQRLSLNLKNHFFPRLKEIKLITICYETKQLGGRERGEGGTSRCKWNHTKHCTLPHTGHRPHNNYDCK